MMRYKLFEDDEQFFEIFHVHTKRCNHATGEDREYIEAAIDMMAKRIVFTDHAPFPGDPFGNRMKMSEYDEYLDTFTALKEEYASQIEVCKGFEIEYLPSFSSYYEKLKADERVDVLLLGQHFYEIKPGEYSLSLPDRSHEYIGLTEAILEAYKTGYFDIVAHPEQVFKRCDDTVSYHDIITYIYKITQSVPKDMYLEDNYASTCVFKRAFWVRARSNRSMKSIKGYDAHSVKDLEKYGWSLQTYKRMLEKYG